MTRVLVCGGRDFGIGKPEEWLRLRSVILAHHEQRRFSLVIEGGAAGADSGAFTVAHMEGIPVQTFKANWFTHGKAAGPIRNQRMIDEGKPDLVIAFPGGRGTADMVKRAKAAGIEVIEVPPSPYRGD